MYDNNASLAILNETFSVIFKHCVYHYCLPVFATTTLTHGLQSESNKRPGMPQSTHLHSFSSKERLPHLWWCQGQLKTQTKE